MNATTVPEPNAIDSGLVLPGRALPPGAGWDWIAGGWKLFVRAPVMWIAAMVLIFIAFIAIGIVPILGGIAVQLLQPVVAAGLIVASQSLERGGNFELDHLFAGFKKNFGNLAIVGLLFMLGGIVIFLIFLAIVAMTVGTAFLTGNVEQIYSTIAASVLTILFGLLVMLALLVPLMAAYWFAPALVILHDMQPMAAMRASFFACFRNFIAFIVYGFIVLVLGFIAMIPFGLGYLVLIPVVMASVYVAYRQIFTEDTAPVVAKPTFA